MLNEKLKNSRPLISIVTVSYNSSPFIVDCIKSISDQDYCHIQHVFVDGGSTDNTLDLIDMYAIDNRLVISEPDNGIFDAMNKGIDAACGDWILFLNTDDFLANDSVVSSLASSLSCLDERVGAVYGGITIIDHKRRPLLSINPTLKAGLSYLTQGLLVPHPATLYKKSSLLEVGCYNSELQIAADYNLNLKLLWNSWSFVNLSDVTVTYMRDGGLSSLRSSIFTAIREVDFSQKSIWGYLPVFGFCLRWAKGVLKYALYSVPARYGFFFRFFILRQIFSARR